MLGLKRLCSITFLRRIVFLLAFVFFFAVLFEEAQFGRKECRHKRSVPPSQFHPSHPPKGWKQILLWAAYYKHYQSWIKVLQRQLKRTCPESRCIFSTVHNHQHTADAILFHAADLPTLSQYESNISYSFQPDYLKRNPNQPWIFMSGEPPANILANVVLKPYANFFNWTMSYRRDSDVFLPYGKLHERKTDLNYSLQSLIPNHPSKSKPVVWMVSRCSSDSGREVMAKELQKHIRVDIYGRCGNMTCGGSSRPIIPLMVPGQKDPCDETLMQYYFYLALENSICKDYITEKFFRSFLLGLIPIVFGDADYEAIAPKGSFIRADDFETLKDLADYLQKVMKDQEQYLSYHSWRRRYAIELGSPYRPFVCGLCQKLHSSQTFPSKTYEDIHDWYVDQSHCKTWTLDESGRQHLVKSSHLQGKLGNEL